MHHQCSACRLPASCFLFPVVSRYYTWRCLPVRGPRGETIHLLVKSPSNWESWCLVANRNSSIKYNFVMLRLVTWDSYFERLFLQCSRRFHPQECWLRAKIHHTRHQSVVFIDFHLMELTGEKGYVIDGVVIDKQGFQLLAQPLCKLVIVRSRGW